MDEITERLARIEEAVCRPALPLDMVLWDYQEVADYLRVNVRTVSERYAVQPGFPKARKPGGGHPRYIAGEVIEWATRS